MPQLCETKAAFDAAVSAAGDKAVIVDFTASWCGPCKMIAPKFQQFSEAYPNIVALKVDVDENEEVAAAFGIEAMPTFIVIKGGKEVKDDRVMGASQEKIEALFKKYN